MSKEEKKDRGRIEVEATKVEAKAEAKAELKAEPKAELKAEAKTEAKAESEPATAETEPPPAQTPAPTPDAPATGAEAWTQPIEAAPETEATASPPATPASVNGSNGAHPNGASKDHLLGHKVCVLSLPEGRAPVNEEVARCIGPFAPTVARAVAHALRSTGTKVSYPVTVVALDTAKSGEEAIVHNERVLPNMNRLSLAWRRRGRTLPAVRSAPVLGRGRGCFAMTATPPRDTYCDVCKRGSIDVM